MIFVLAGNEKETMKLLGRGNGNVGSLLPYVFRFPDYSDEEPLALPAAGFMHQEEVRREDEC